MVFGVAQSKVGRIVENRIQNGKEKNLNRE